MSLFFQNKMIPNVSVVKPDMPIEKEVNFYDWEGTILYSYTKDEFLALTEMPPAPDMTADNLVQEGWNWTLSEVQGYVNRDDVKWFGVGCTYHTLDDKTHIYARPTSDFPTIWLYPTASVANATTIDWGDGNTMTLDSTSATQLSHTYTTFDEKDITIHSSSGTHTFSGQLCGSEDYNFKSQIHTILFSQSCIDIFNQFKKSQIEYLSVSKHTIRYYTHVGFQYIYNLKHLNLNLSTNYFHSDGSFRDCYNLRNLIIKRTSSSTVCENCYSLQHFNFFSITLYGICYNCFSLKTFSMMYNTVSISAAMLSSCYSLKEITFPSTVEYIAGNALKNCVNLLIIYCTPTTPPTIQSTTFSGVNSNCIIYVPRASFATYQSATNWSNFASQMVAYDFE